MYTFKGKGLVWDKDIDKPLAKFTDGAFETDSAEAAEKLKALGYECVSEPEAAAKKTVDEMTIEELKAYAAEKGIDISGLTVKADILAKIKEVEGAA